MKLGSLFDGIGGWLIAAKRNGIRPVWASEVERFPIAVTKHHHPEVEHLGDITKLNGAEIEPVDIITSGSPCQNLSIAGNRKGLEGNESGLFYESTRLLREMRAETNGRYPRFYVWENVVGAFTSNEGRDFRSVLESLADTHVPMPESGRWAGAGMVRSRRCDIVWRTLNAEFWGTAQRRKRVFLIADFAAEGYRQPEILFKEINGRRNHQTVNRAEKRDTAEANGHFKGCLTPWDSQTERIQGLGGIFPTLSSNIGGQKCLLIFDDRGEPSIRKITPLEAERLQGLPDGYTDVPGASDTARYKALGNGMAQPCADFVMSVIKRLGEA